MEGPVGTREQHQYIVGCTNDDVKRLAVLEELVATEHTYLKDLQVLIKGYLTPLRHSMILSDLEVDLLACNIVAIRDLHQDIFDHFLDLIHRSKDFPHPPLSSSFVLYFDSISERLKLYSTYAR
jgi:hypothetical protein